MKDNIYDEMYKIEATNWWFRAKRSILIDLMTTNGSLKDGARVLDCGCGCGYMLKSLKDHTKAYLFGTDYSYKALEYTKERFNGDLRQADISKEKPYQDEFFDTILISDVLEHIDNDFAAIKNLQDMLKRYGQLYITVPAFKCLWSPHDEEHMHFRRYDLTDLKNKLLVAGFRINYISYYNFWTFIPVWLVRKIKNLLRINKADTGETCKPINLLLEKIFSSEVGWMKRGKTFPFGVSIIAVVTKI